MSNINFVFLQNVIQIYQNTYQSQTNCNNNSKLSYVYTISVTNHLSSYTIKERDSWTKIQTAKQLEIPEYNGIVLM